uniref:Putative salivary lipocalin n=1 Tax=Ixodes ricinus TaxID=34613 RepID=A0A0K8RDP9_IXORI
MAVLDTVLVHIHKATKGKFEKHAVDGWSGRSDPETGSVFAEIFVLFTFMCVTRCSIFSFTYLLAVFLVINSVCRISTVEKKCVATAGRKFLK